MARPLPRTNDPQQMRLQSEGEARVSSDRLRATLEDCFAPEWRALAVAIAEQMLSNVEGWELWLALQADLVPERAAQLAASRRQICPGCSDGRPICTDKKPDGSIWTHDETCATYRWADDLCESCAATLDDADGSVA